MWLPTGTHMHTRRARHRKEQAWKGGEEKRVQLNNRRARRRTAATNVVFAKCACYFKYLQQPRRHTHRAQPSSQGVPHFPFASPKALAFTCSPFSSSKARYDRSSAGLCSTLPRSLAMAAKCDLCWCGWVRGGQRRRRRRSKQARRHPSKTAPATTRTTKARPGGRRQFHTHAADACGVGMSAWSAHVSPPESLPSPVAQELLGDAATTATSTLTPFALPSTSTAQGRK